MANPDRAILSSPKFSHYHQVIIKRPDGVIYRTITTNQNSGIGDISAFATSANFDTPPGSFSNVLSVSLEHRLVYCRQLCGWPVEINLISTNGQTSYTNPVTKASIGKTTIKGNYVDLEIIPIYARAKKKSSFTVSQNCTLVFGETDCGVDPERFYIDQISALSSDGLTLDVNYIPVFYPDANHLYSITIGDTDYKVTSFNSFLGTLSNITVNRKILGRPDVISVQKSCDQTAIQCQKYNNSIKYRGVVIPASTLSLNI